MNEIIVRDVTAIPLLLDENDEEIKFHTRDHAVAYLRKNGYSVEDIAKRKMRFIYTNESRECRCHLCEKTHSECVYRDRFQRLPRDKSNGMGLGKCPKLK